MLAMANGVTCFANFLRIFPVRIENTRISLSLHPTTTLPLSAKWMLSGSEGHSSVVSTSLDSKRHACCCVLQSS